MFGISGIFVSYLTYGLLQEQIYKHVSPDGTKFTYTLTLLVLQCVVNALMAALLSFRGRGLTGVPFFEFALPGLSYIGAMLFSNEALKFVTYPMQALAKSSKMIPVMLTNVIVFHKRYSIREYSSVVLITLGILIFQWKPPKDSHEENSIFGLLLLFGSLAFDGITGPTQDHIKKKYKDKVEQHQLMLCTNLWAVIYLVIAMVVTGETWNGFAYIIAPGNEALPQYLMMFCLCSAVGQTMIFYTMFHFGALVCTTITTTRKFFTIFASIVYFGHTLSSQQYWAVLCVFVGLTLELLGSYLKDEKQATVDEKKK